MYITPILIKTVAFAKKMRNQSIDTSQRLIFYSLYKDIIPILDRIEEFVMNRIITNMFSGCRFS